MGISRVVGVGMLCLLGLAGAGAAVLAGGERVGDPFTLRDCPVAQHAIGEMQEPVVRVYEGREIRFCCEDCIETFEADLKASLAEVDKTIVASQMPFYPTEKCLVSGEELGSMGKPVDMVWNNRLVRLCCKGCVKTFTKNPAAVVAKLDEAVKEAQRKDYPIEICPVSDEKLGGMGEPTEIVAGNRLVRFCCAGCEGEFYKNPGEIIGMLDEAWKAKKPEMFAAHAAGEPQKK